MYGCWLLKSSASPVKLCMESFLDPAIRDLSRLIESMLEFFECSSCVFGLTALNFDIPCSRAFNVWPERRKPKLLPRFYWLNYLKFKVF